MTVAMLRHFLEGLGKSIVQRVVLEDRSVRRCCDSSSDQRRRPCWDSRMSLWPGS